VPIYRAAGEGLYVCLLRVETLQTINIGDNGSHLAVQDIPTLMKPEVQHRLHTSNMESFVHSPPNHRRLRSRLIIPFHICLGVHSGFLAKILYVFPSRPCVCHSPPISYVCTSDRIYDVWRTAACKTTNFLIL